MRHGHVGDRLQGREVARIVQRTVAAAGLDPKSYAGHSLRAGLATSADRAGKSTAAIMAQGGWRTPATAFLYARINDLLSDDNATFGIGF